MYDEAKIIKKMFTVLDSDEDDYIDFYDFGLFIQIFHVYDQIDSINKGRIFAGELYEGILKTSGIPSISSSFKQKAKRLSLVEKDVYVDVFTFMIIIKLDDFIERFKRLTTPDLMTEIDINSILKKLDLEGIPYSKYADCARGRTKQEIKLLDWECVFVNVIKETLHFYEKSEEYITAKNYNMTLSTMEFEFPKALVE